MIDWLIDLTACQTKELRSLYDLVFIFCVLVFSEFDFVLIMNTVLSNTNNFKTYLFDP